MILVSTCCTRVYISADPVLQSLIEGKNLYVIAFSMIAAKRE